MPPPPRHDHQNLPADVPLDDTALSRKADMHAEPGKTVALTLCKAWRGQEETTVSGLWIIEERIFYDRSAHQHESGFILVREDEADEKAVAYAEARADGGTLHEQHMAGVQAVERVREMVEVFIDDCSLWEQIDPQGYGRMLVQEREADFAAENDWR